jgi:hypothetical protein
MNSVRHIIPGTLLAVLLNICMNAQSGKGSLKISETSGEFPLSVSGKTAPVFVDPGDFPGVIRACRDLRDDIGRVTDALPLLFTEKIPQAEFIVIVGTVGKSEVIDRLSGRQKINVNETNGRWESFVIEVVDKPLPGINKALVIAGSDKRGTIYGIYELSARIGVSPWYWWADVPAAHRDNLYVTGRSVQGSPCVKYRGIFLNDEAPDLTNWVAEKYGFVKPSDDPPIPQGVANYNHEFYGKLFELILRLKGNCLWPAMWNNAFNEDDPENPALADEYGIVMGTTHQEPMLRAQKEWDRQYQKTLGSWDYIKNPEVLRDFWREGVRRNKNYESIITLGLRGADDTEMAPGGPDSNKTMLEGIVTEQRKIIAGEINPDVTRVPQLWCLYKEVQDYYKAGMRVPDDVTLLWAEDNWGNLRRLPTSEERQRTGGSGIYYHFDYHGGPRSYQWINTSPVPKIWDQMSLARQYGADRIWMVNVGHLKGYEFPLEYFMNLAWYADSLRNDNIKEYTRCWAERQFGKEFRNEIAEIISEYTRFNGRRKPELLSPSTYSLVNYREAETVVSDYKDLASQAEVIYNKLPEKIHDAFYQLVLFPVKACAIVNELYTTAGKNQLYARQKRAGTRELAGEVQRLFSADTSLMGYYNRCFAGGKWTHFMDQPHLGYTSWRDPPVNSLGAIDLNQPDVPEEPGMGISVEGSELAWPDSSGQTKLPEFDALNRQSFYFEVFNKGRLPFEFEIENIPPWAEVSNRKGTVHDEIRVWVSIDWIKIPEGKIQGILTIKGTGKTAKIGLTVFRPFIPGKFLGFIEGNGYVSMEAEHFTHKTDKGENHWICIEDYGHTLSGMRATGGTNDVPLIPGSGSPCLEYRIYLFSAGMIRVNAAFAPTLNFKPGSALRFAIAMDNEKPQIVTLVPEDYNAQNGNADWEKAVSDNLRTSCTSHHIPEPGDHTLKIWMVDPGAVLQKIVVDTGGLKPSYLGPPESYYKIDCLLPDSF